MICTDKLKRLRDKCRGSKMGSIARNDQNALLYDVMQKIRIKCEQNMQKEFENRDSNSCS